jgi:NAD(P)-dependent dehydrogenase (short-subunit alcohol dehydrogenase family)
MNSISPELFRLDGQVAIVTGASSGLGVACACSLAEAGATVVVAARRRPALTKTACLVESFGSRALAVEADVTRRNDCEALADAALKAFGRIDIVVNNAGVASAIPALAESSEEFTRVVEVNLHGSFNMASAAAGHMAGGSIVNVSSILALTTAGLPQAAYSSSKAAILGLTRDLAQQWGSRKGIRVNAVCPGFFTSEMTDEYPPGYLDQVVSRRTLLGRLGRPDELAATVVFLASPAAGYITGATLTVDGGVTIT